MLYSRDYTILTAEEQKKLQKAKDYKARGESPRIFTTKQFFKYHEMMPKAGYHYESLFPNNYLCLTELDDHDRLDKIAEDFGKLLDSGVGEREVLNFINQNEYYCLIGGILKSSYFFGHHGAYAFKEFPLPPNFIADYLLIGDSSGGHQFVFVELENPTGSITNKDGTFGTTIRKGIKQVEDWEEWIESNFPILELLFEKAVGSTEPLPKEFRKLDKTRIHFAIVAGRRKDFSEKTYRLRRQLKQQRNITLLHYDNLIDTLQVFKTSGNY